MATYKLLNGRALDLGRLGAREQTFLRDLQKMARQNISYFELARIAVGPGSVALSGRNRIDRRIVESPLYLAARDIATRAGITQGLILAPEYEHERAKAPADFSMMSVAQAAELIGITKVAVYKAIDKGTIKALRIGNVTVVERASVKAYSENRPGEEKPEGTPTHGKPARNQPHRRLQRAAA